MVSVEIANKEAFNRGLERARNSVSDLRVPLNLIAIDFYKSQKSIFDSNRKGPGQYADLSQAYKAAKMKEVGFVYPILKRTGLLEESVTNAASTNGGYVIINKDTLVFTTRVPYAEYLQNGTSKMPARPFFLVGPEAPRYATSQMQGRMGRWLNILNDFVIQKLNSELKTEE